jgi:hypothetical protein
VASCSIAGTQVNSDVPLSFLRWGSNSEEREKRKRNQSFGIETQSTKQINFIFKWISHRKSASQNPRVSSVCRGYLCMPRRRHTAASPKSQPAGGTTSQPTAGDPQPEGSSRNGEGRQGTELTRIGLPQIPPTVVTRGRDLRRRWPAHLRSPGGRCAVRDGRVPGSRLRPQPHDERGGTWPHTLRPTLLWAASAVGWWLAAGAARTRSRGGLVAWRESGGGHLRRRSGCRPRARRCAGGRGFGGRPCRAGGSWEMSLVVDDLNGDGTWWGMRSGVEIRWGPLCLLFLSIVRIQIHTHLKWKKWGG